MIVYLETSHVSAAGVMGYENRRSEMLTKPCENQGEPVVPHGVLIAARGIRAILRGNCLRLLDDLDAVKPSVIADLCPDSVHFLNR